MGVSPCYAITAFRAGCVCFGLIPPSSFPARMALPNGSPPFAGAGFRHPPACPGGNRTCEIHLFLFRLARSDIFAFAFAIRFPFMPGERMPAQRSARRLASPSFAYEKIQRR
jgi:hypothetical protein